MLLEAAMAELREASTCIILNDRVQSTNMGLFQELGKGGQINSNINAMDKEKLIGNTDASTDAISLLQDDHEFVSRMLNRERSNLVESAWFGYKSTELAAGAVPFQWEAEPGKPKNHTIKEEEELPPLSLPPIRLSNASHTPASSATQSPLSLTGKMKSLLINVKRSGDSTSSSTPEPTFNKSPSKRSSHRAVKPEIRSPLSSHHGPLQSSISPYYSRNGAIKGKDYTPQNNLNYIAAADNSMLYCPASSPYYFSPLSNSSFLSQDLISPRASIAQSSTVSTISHASINSNTYSHASSTSHTSSRASNSSISIVSSTSNGSAMLANGLLSITSLSDEAPPEENGGQNGSNSVSLASPELEILDEGLTTSHNVSKAEITMAEFINRGGPLMNRSLSTPRVTFADDLFRKQTKKKYYSAQLNALAQPKTNFSPMQDPTCSALDKLFPLRRPNLSKLSTNLASKYESDGSPDDRRVYEDALDTSLDCSIVTEDGVINNSMMASCSPLERPAQEVVIQENDENGFAYSPVATAFVFSPRRSSQNTASNFVFSPRRSSQNTASNFFRRSSQNTASNFSKPSSGAHNTTTNAANGKPELKSILKKTGTNYSQELNGAPCTTPDQGPNIDSMDHNMQQKRLNDTEGSQKISSVLLRFAEAEEQLYNSRSRKHHADGIRPPAACLPMCSFLGRAFLCRSKLATHGHLHE